MIMMTNMINQNHYYSSEHLFYPCHMSQCSLFLIFATVTFKFVSYILYFDFTSLLLLWFKITSLTVTCPSILFPFFLHQDSLISLLNAPLQSRSLALHHLTLASLKIYDSPSLIPTNLQTGIRFIFTVRLPAFPTTFH